MVIIQTTITCCDQIDYVLSCPVWLKNMYKRRITLNLFYWIKIRVKIDANVSFSYLIRNYELPSCVDIFNVSVVIIGHYSVFKRVVSVSLKPWIHTANYWCWLLLCILWVHLQLNAKFYTCLKKTASKSHFAHMPW